MQRLMIPDSGHVEVCELPDPGPLPDGKFDVRTMFSGLSTGTELSFVKGTHPALSSCWDPELGLFRQRDRANPFPIHHLGYMEVGEVVASRTPAVAVGNVVAMTYGHASAHRGDPLTDRFVVLPDGVDPVLGIYVAHMGPICANGLLHAGDGDLASGVAGRRVVVTGAGVVGLLTALFARRHGAASVVVVDPDERRRATAAALGLDTLDPDSADPAVTLKTRWRHAAADRGADVVFQCRGRARYLALALRLLRPQGIVVDLAFYEGGAPELRLGEEFHHNGLEIRCAQIGRVPRGMAHRWDRDRLSAETIALLDADGDGIRRHLLTDFLGLAEGPRFLRELADRRRGCIQAVFTF